MKSSGKRESWGRGSVAALFALVLPVLLLSASLAVDAGWLFVARQRLVASADLAALAACQELDLNLLAGGWVHLDPDRAGSVARQYAGHNLTAAFGGRVDPSRAEIEVEVYNLDPGSPVRHRLTGRLLSDPTVAVQIVLPVRPPLLSAALGEVRVSGRADASVVRKK